MATFIEIRRRFAAILVTSRTSEIAAHMVWREAVAFVGAGVACGETISIFSPLPVELAI